MRLANIALIACLAIPAARASQLTDAARDNDAARVQQLIKAGADVNARGPDGGTALLWAAHFADADLVRALLKAGADPSVANLFGATPISEAAEVGSAAIIEQLLKAGVDPNSTNPEGQQPLMVVARTGRTDAAEVLLRHGAEVDARESWGGQTALMWAASQGHPAMIELLLKHHADANAHGVARNWQRRVTVEPRKKIMADGGFTPLMYAARENCIECVGVLLAGGADIDDVDPDRVTSLNLALLNRHFDLAAALIEAGADVNKWDFAGRTPLYNAIDMNTPPPNSTQPIADKLTGLDIVDLLLARGADPNIQLKHRPEYRDGVYERGADIMLSVGATPLMRAARSADVPVMKLLLAHGAMVELPNQYGVTPFMVAAGTGFGVRATRGTRATEAMRIEALQLLLEHGAEINRRNLSQGRIEPAGEDNFLYRIRITYGNQRYIFSYVPPDGRIAMHGAAMNGWTEVVNFLAAHGSDIDTRGRDGKSALDLAAGNYEPEILVPPPDPFPETVAALEQLCEARQGCAFAAPTVAEAGLADRNAR
ncbi:MAG: ankyrin repeat domain-containing protein [Gammaproteobacteria bacterium]|nr:ankyrin repeat domain-containing protein [Gammaproteobacteria bacterium]